MTRFAFANRHIRRSQAFVLGLATGIAITVIVFAICTALTRGMEITPEFSGARQPNNAACEESAPAVVAPVLTF